jgi:thiol-disulfide isomerase/thioredoxin
MRGWRYRFLALLAVGLLTIAAWHLAHHEPPLLEGATPGTSPQAAAAPSPVTADAAATPRPRLFVLAINGGGSPPQNYLSHLQHLQGLVDLLHSAGVPAERITVLAGDGSDPTPDLAVRLESPDTEYWRLRGTALEEKFPPRLLLGNSAVTGATLYPATRGSLSIWTLTVGQQMRAGDVLLLYVTDHGTMGATAEDNRIVLWGAGQGLSVKELRDTLETLDPSVRVVALMSQCYSGGFASLLSLGGGPGESTGRFCGFFSAQENGKAYGCYPETRDDPKVGHSFAFLRALPVAGGDLARAHALVIERDDTPDQPMRTSDLYNHHLLEEAARARQLTARQLADDRLGLAWARPRAFDGPAQQLDRIAARFGLGSVRSHAEVEQTRVRLRDLQSRLDDAAQQLGSTLADLNQRVLLHFVRARPAWQSSLKPAALKAMDVAERAPLGVRLVTELASFAETDSDGPTQAAAQEMLEAETRLAFRATIRLAVLGRMDLVLDSVAAAELIGENPDARAARERLLACEALVLPIPKGDWPPAAALPALEDDLAQAEMILALTSVDDRGKTAGPRPGDPAPELDLAAYRGQLPPVGNGTPLLLFFWATWCKPCKAIVPDLLALAEKRNLTVVAIAQESAADLDRFFATVRQFPALVGRDAEARATARLGLRAIPSFLLIDGQGRVASRLTHSLRDVEAALAE